MKVGISTVGGFRNNVGMCYFQQQIDEIEITIHMADFMNDIICQQFVSAGYKVIEL